MEENFGVSQTMTDEMNATERTDETMNVHYISTALKLNLAIILILIFLIGMTYSVRGNAADFLHHDEWTKADTQREAVYLTIDFIDYMQTRQIALHPDRWTERNNAIGAHPELRQVSTFFAVAALAHTGFAYILPEEWRAPFQYVTIGFEGATVLYNYQLGISIEW